MPITSPNKMYPIISIVILNKNHHERTIKNQNEYAHDSFISVKIKSILNEKTATK
jgi:hypothetical protein